MILMKSFVFLLATWFRPSDLCPGQNPQSSYYNVSTIFNFIIVAILSLEDLILWMFDSTSAYNSLQIEIQNMQIALSKIIMIHLLIIHVYFIMK